MSPPTRQRNTSLASRGEPWIWILASGQIAAVLMIAGLVTLILYQGFLTFWPRPLVSATVAPGLVPEDKLLGEVSRREWFRPHGAASSNGAVQQQPAEERILFRTGNYDLYGDDFKWVESKAILRQELPADAVAIERREWGVFFGFVEAFQVDGKSVTGGRSEAWERFQGEHAVALARRREIHRLEKDEIGDINHEIEANRLASRRAEILHGPGSPEHVEATASAEAEDARLKARHDELAGAVQELKAEDGRFTVLLRDVRGQEKVLPASEVVRAYRPNALGVAEKIGVYVSRWWEYLWDEPREANTEGGVFPAIFGTVSMTLLMALLVAPFGVMAALYLREYARQGLLVSCVRVAVNNLAGVPSIVFGVFGLGFFCYVVGGSIDQVFFQERLPAPTFGTGGLLWASLTLALMTVPVVIVATEEALAAVPKSLREGAYACGASKWQMIWQVVLPRSMPGILTGLVLAMARGAGEVAPLMITGVVKLAPDLAIDGRFPFVHLERSFMHLGFHIYDVGFQSRNAEAGKPMVFTTTLLLITVVLLMNLTVIRVRARLKRKFAVGQF